MEPYEFKRNLPPGLVNGLLFFAVVVVGSGYIIFSKLNDFGAMAVTAVPVLIMIGYAGLLGARLFRLRDDQSGDSLYYMGFLFTLTSLANQYFVENAGARVAFITDTLYTEALKPALVKLAKGAWRLYCDSFYAKAQEKNARQHKHMMAYQSAELARAAKVEQLVLMHFSTRYVDQYELLLNEAAAVFPRVTAELGTGPQ